MKNTFSVVEVIRFPDGTIVVQMVPVDWDERSKSAVTMIVLKAEYYTAEYLAKIAVIIEDIEMIEVQWESTAIAGGIKWLFGARILTELEDINVKA